jgi:hypothetical protein
MALAARRRQRLALLMPMLPSVKANSAVWGPFEVSIGPPQVIKARSLARYRQERARRHLAERLDMPPFFIRQVARIAQFVTIRDEELIRIMENLIEENMLK